MATPAANLLGILLLTVSLFPATSCGSREPVTIGYLGGLSGKMADIGTYGRDGAILAVEARNAAGGIRGRTVTLDARDDGQDPGQAARMVAELADRGALAIVGPVTSAMAMAVVPVSERRRLVLVSPTVTTEDLSGKDDFFLRIVPTVGRISARMADHLALREGIRRVATVCDMNNRAYTEKWLLRFRDRFESGGGTVVASECFVSTEDVRLAPLARRLLGSGAEAILIAANASDAAMICQQLQKLGWKGRIALVEWASSEKFISRGGSAAEGVFASQFFDRESRDPRYLAFVEAYRKRFGTDPGFASVLGHEAANLVMDGLEADGLRGGEPLKAELLRDRTRRGLQETYSIDPFGDAVRDTHIAVVRDRAYRVVR